MYAPTGRSIVDRTRQQQTNKAGCHKRQARGAERYARQSRRKNADGGKNHEPFVNVAAVAKPQGPTQENHKGENVADAKRKKATGSTKPVGSFGKTPMKPCRTLYIAAA
jgi:hypothetical protein